jgi:two-component system LytT family response regulator
MPGKREQLPCTTQRRSAMRAVIVDCDASRREFLRRMVMSDRAYDLVGEAESGEECAEIVARELPELAICNRVAAPPILDAQQPFPLLISIASGESVRSERVVCEVAVPLRESHIAEALALAASRILQLEINSLSSLIGAYLVHEEHLRTPLQRIEVEDAAGRQRTLSTDEILWIKAAGNYVQIYARAGTFELRETISNMAAKLQGSGFIRIHRSMIVNDRAVKHRIVNDGRASVVLWDGTELFVGPNFRDHVPAGLGQFSPIPSQV